MGRLTERITVVPERLRRQEIELGVQPVVAGSKQIYEGHFT